MNRSRTYNYLAGLVSGYTVTFVTIVVGLWLTPFTLRFLDRQEYGIFALCGDILLWLNLMDLGIGAGLRVRAAQLTAHNDYNNLNRLASTAFLSELIIAGILVMAGAAVALYFPSFFQVRPDLQTSAQQVIAIMALGVAMSLATQSFSGLLVAHQQLHIDNLIRLGLVVIRLILTVVLLLWGWKLLALAMANVAATMIISLLAISRVYRSLPDISIKLHLASWDLFKSLATLGFWFSVGGIAGIFIKGMDRVVAGRLISLESVTTLVLTGRLYLLAWSLLARLTETARPALGQILGSGDLTTALVNYRRLFVVTVGGAIVVALSLWTGNGTFISWWVGSKNYGGWPLDLALALNLIVNCWILPNRATLAAALIVRPQSVARLIEGLINLALAIILGIYYGLVGVAISTAIAGLITSCWYLPLLTSRLFQRNYFRFLWEDSSRLLVLGAILAIVAYFVRFHSVHFTGFLSAIINMGITFIIGSSLLYIIVFDRQLKILLYGNIILPSKIYGILFRRK